METRHTTPVDKPRAASRPSGWRGALGGAGLCLMALAGCDPGTTMLDNRADLDLPNDRVLHSPHFAYHARAEDVAICGDLLNELERHFFHMQDLLGFTWPAGRIIHYYKFMDADDYVAHAPCPAESGGCTDSDGVYAYDPFEQHELVHAYFWPLGAPPTVFSEGAAVALSCTQGIAESPSLSLADALAVRDSLSDMRVYDTGGRIARYLIDTYGPEAFLGFYSSLPREATFVDVDQAMRSLFGAGAEALWTAALETHASCPPPFACSRETLPGDGRAVFVEGTCGLPMENRTFAIASGGDVAIAAPASTKLGSCDPIPFAQTLASTYEGGRSQVGLLRLAAGRYYLDFPSRGANDLAVLEPSEAWAGSQCSDLEPFVVGGDQYETVAVALPRGETPWNIKLRFEEPQRLALSRSAVARAPLKIRVCPDCDVESSRCQTLELGDDPVEVAWQGDYVLHLDSLSPEHVDRIQIAER